ncbi:hypothetical protein D3C78_1761340 [compost metagenome]
MLGLRNTLLLQHLFAHGFIHCQSGGQNPVADIWDIQQLQQSLHRSIFSIGAMQQRQRRLFSRKT